MIHPEYRIDEALRKQTGKVYCVCCHSAVVGSPYLLLALHGINAWQGGSLAPTFFERTKVSQEMNERLSNAFLMAKR